MSDLDNILNEDKEWRKEFDAMKVTGNCDSGCGKPATHWFGNTSAATCGASICVQKQQDEYDNHANNINNRHFDENAEDY